MRKLLTEHVFVTFQAFCTGLTFGLWQNSFLAGGFMSSAVLTIYALMLVFFHREKGVKK